MINKDILVRFSLVMSLTLVFFSRHIMAREQISPNPDKVSYLPGYGSPTQEQYSGYLSIQSAVSRTSEHFYYYLVAAKNDTSKTPLILWLNGGPGSSSFYGFFTENGPYKIQPDLKLKDNPAAWSTKYNFLIFDQPIGVGYSFPSQGYQIKDEVQTTHELYLALVAFYQKYPQLLQRKLYIAGESYAGKYIPEVASVIEHRNHSGLMPKIPLAGIILGDAWVNPLIQQSKDAEYAYTHGLIDESGVQVVNSYYQVCANAIRAESISSSETDAKCGKMADYIYSKSGIDLHNIHAAISNEANNPYTIEYDTLVRYLNQSTVKAQLHVKSNESFNLYSSFVGDALTRGEQNSVANLIPALLDQKISVLVFNGLDDAKDCNFLGTNLWLRNLNWQGFNQAKQQIMYAHDKEVSGYIIRYKNLRYVKLLNAGHMAAEDQPVHTLNMLEDFINDN